jgi:fimbrial chaperone protein
VEISGARRTASVTVRNEENVPVTIRAYPLAWRQEGGEDHYDETAELIVSPPVFTIAPHATQTVRVGARRPSAAPRPYRLIIEEVPEAAPPGSGIRVALRLNLPLYANLAPGARADLSWRAYRQADGVWAIEARNNGAGWIRVEQALAEAATGLRLTDGFGFGTVLPGAARRWLVGADPRIGDRARFQQINRTADHGAPSPPQPHL